MKEKSNQVKALPEVKLKRKYGAGNSIRENCGEIFRLQHKGINEGNKISQAKGSTFRKQYIGVEKRYVWDLGN